MEMREREGERERGRERRVKIGDLYCVSRLIISLVEKDDIELRDSRM